MDFEIIVASYAKAKDPSTPAEQRQELESELASIEDAVVSEYLGSQVHSGGSRSYSYGAAGTPKYADFNQLWAAQMLLCSGTPVKSVEDQSDRIGVIVAHSQALKHYKS